MSDRSGIQQESQACGSWTPIVWFLCPTSILSQEGGPSSRPRSITSRAWLSLPVGDTTQPQGDPCKESAGKGES